MRATQEVVYKYFLGVQHEQDLKKLFKELAMTMHPDKGGSHDQFVMMKLEYDTAIKKGIYPIGNSNTANPFKFGFDPYGDMNDIFNNFHTRAEQARKEKERQREEARRKAELDPKEIERKRAIKYFNEQRQNDKTFDIIDNIIESCYRLGSDPDFRWVAIYREISKMDYLEVVHFKYFSFKMGKGAGVGVNMYQQYLKNKV